jgi:LacI family transcriptional regulator
LGVFSEGFPAICFILEKIIKRIGGGSGFLNGCREFRKERLRMEAVKTIYDIAKEAGVSASTVSRVVNNKPGVNENTRKKVQQLLEKYNYIPNEAARGLVTQSSRIIGILIEDIRVVHHTESAYVIEQEMTRLGYTCITLSTGPDPKKKAEYIRHLEQRRVEGAILMGSMFGTSEVEESIHEHLSGIPIVIVNGYLNLPNVYSVIADEERGIEECVELLASKGRKNIAFVMDAETPSNNSKKRGFMTAMMRQGIPSEKQLLYQADWEGVSLSDPRNTILRGAGATRRLLQENPQVDAIVYCVDLLAIGGIHEMESQGIAVPEQIAVMGVDNTIYGEICRPQLSTLDNKLVEVSRNASGILLNALEKKEVSKRMMLYTEIIEREST